MILPPLVFPGFTCFTFSWIFTEFLGDNIEQNMQILTNILTHLNFNLKLQNTIQAKLKQSKLACRNTLLILSFLAQTLILMFYPKLFRTKFDLLWTTTLCSLWHKVFYYRANETVKGIKCLETIFNCTAPHLSSINSTKGLLLLLWRGFQYLVK